MEIVKIKAYNFDELSVKGKCNAIGWLDECPLEYEDEEGNLHYQYFSEADEVDVVDHCNTNGYLFNESGKPIHHMIVEEENA